MLVFWVLTLVFPPLENLFAAIPAVIAYNRFSAGAESLIARYDVFVEEFASIVNRQAVSGRRRG